MAAGTAPLPTGREEMIGHDFYRWRDQRDEMEHKRREAWLIGFFWGATVSMALYSFTVAAGKVLGLLP